MIDHAVTLVQELHHLSAEKWHHEPEKRRKKSNWKIITQAITTDSSLPTKLIKRKLKACLNTTYEKQNTDVTLNDCLHCYQNIYQLLKNLLSQITFKDKNDNKLRHVSSFPNCADTFFVQTSNLEWQNIKNPLLFQLLQ